MEISGGAFRVTKLEKVMVADQLAAAWLRYAGVGGADTQGLQVLRFREGKIAELWGFDPDDAQEGVPAPPSAVSQPVTVAVDESLAGEALKARFEAAVSASRTLPKRPDNAMLLELYALFKQGTAGDANGERPGFTDLVGRAKFDAWSRLAGTDRDSAMRRYVAIVDGLDSPAAAKTGRLTQGSEI